MSQNNKEIKPRDVEVAKALLYNQYRQLFKDYEALAIMDLGRGRISAKDGVLVPAPIARRLNELREALGADSPAEAYHEASSPLPQRLLDKVTKLRVWAIEQLQDPKLIGVQEAAPTAPPSDSGFAHTVGSRRPPEEVEMDEPPEPGKVTVASAKKREEESAAASATANAATNAALEAVLEDMRTRGYRNLVAYREGAFNARIAQLGRLAGSLKSSAEGMMKDDLEKLSKRSSMRKVVLRTGWREALKTLANEMPNFGEVIDRVAQQCLLAQETEAPLRIQPILLVGPPGVGKTHFARRLAETLEVPMYNYPMESAETTSTLTGSDKHWGNSQPGALFDLIIRGDVANPLVILDEIDKAPASSRVHYQPRMALYPLLEPSTAEAIRDKSAEIEFNAGHVIYVATANALSPIERPLLTRFDIHLIRELTPQQAVSVARHIHQQVVEDRCLVDFERPGPGVIQELALIGNPRQIHRLLVLAIARAIERGGQERNRLQVADLALGAGEQRQPLH